MMVAVSILASVAASALFYFVEPHLLALGQPLKALGTLGVFLLSGGLAFFLQKRHFACDAQGPSMMSDNQVQLDMDAKVDGLDSKRGSIGNVLSGNRVGGSANFEIKNSKL